MDEYGIQNVISKNSGSRLVQACLKYGNNTSRELIFLKIMKSNPEKIFTDNFGKYLIKKIMIHVKDKKLLQILNSYMMSNFFTLYDDPNGNIALSGYIESLPEHRSLELLQERLKKPANDEDASAKVAGFIEQKSLQNSLTQFWLYYYWSSIPEESKKLIVEELKENLDQLIDSKIHGILLYCKIFDYVELKDKTKMLKKCVSKKIDEMLKKNPNILFLFVKITNSYDDSGNISNIIFNEVVTHLYSFVENQSTATFLFYILCEDFDKEFSVKFHPKLVEAIRETVMSNSGKKPIDRKLEEARSKIFTLQSFQELLKPDFIQKAFDSTFICVMISMILNHFIKSESCKEAIPAFLELLSNNVKESLETDPNFENPKSLLISHPFTQRMVKKFIQSFSTASADYKQELEAAIEGFVMLLLENMSSLLQTRAVFIYIALIENTSYASLISSKLRAYPGYKDLEKSSNQGLKILVKLVEQN